MELQPQQSGRTLVLSPAGRIDHTHADAFKAALDPHLSDCVKEVFTISRFDMLFEIFTDSGAALAAVGGPA